MKEEAIADFELATGIKIKDKELFLSAISALIAHCDDEDSAESMDDVPEEESPAATKKSLKELLG